MIKKNNSWITSILIHLALILFASVLFAASFPNPIFTHGLPFLAWFAYIPILVVICKYNILACAGWGAVYGYTAYSLFNYWLSGFHPLAGTITFSFYMVFLAVVFVFFKIANLLYLKRAYLVQWIIWLAYEYIRTLGFLGYPYGVTGYSQWQMIPLIQIASITGVWGISALVTFPSFWLAAAFNENKKEIENAEQENEKKNKIKKNQTAEIIKKKTFLEIIKNTLSNSVQHTVKFFIKEKVSAIIWVTVLIASLTFGIIRINNYSSNLANYGFAQIALIQHNTDPWAANKADAAWQRIEAYRRDLSSLIRLSNEALQSQIKPQLVVWPETSFIPRINWHSTYREDQNTWILVRDLLEYLSVQNIPFLIGNDNAMTDSSKNPNAYEKFRVDYNAAMLFEKGENTAVYHKIHLVPFTEHFPYKKQFPKFYSWLEKEDTQFWEKGEEETVFNLQEFSFSAPICFEDTFGYLSRNFVRNGADILVNLSNDSWSKSLSSQYQHLSLAVFRTVENFRSMVRSTASGQTCAIDPTGRVTAEADPFKETWINVKVPVLKGSTIYTQYGDYLGLFFVIMAVILLLSGAIWCTMKKLNAKKPKAETKVALQGKKP
ncbi:MAG: apolipoprotein N-acyltransferase [Treponema sp.]|nr:apolipoprotein N-acyltransferase [Treponema sp.]MCL2251827.1 apolipoprotein N-acyltransferase [Treponema sp.]